MYDLWMALAVVSIVLSLWCVINVIRPFPKLGINHRGLAIVFFIITVAGFGQFSQWGSAARDREIEALRVTDPDAYFVELRKARGDAAYLKILKEQYPDRYAREQPAIQEALVKQFAKDHPIEDDGPSQADKESTWIAKGQEAVEARLKDGGSAKFRKLQFSNKSGIPMSCGEVNSKNSLGGYVGYQRYVSGGSADLTFLEEEVADFDKVWKKFCAG